MKQIERILEHVKHTNPEMAMDRLIEELLLCRSTAISLAIICENDKESACIGI